MGVARGAYLYARDGSLGSHSLHSSLDRSMKASAAQQTELLPPEEPGTDIAIVVAKDPGIVLLDTEKFDAWYDKLKANAPTNVDISTKSGRDTLRSYAADIRSDKAGIDKARLRLTEQWREMTNQANAAGKIIKERLEALAIEVRKPLTEWEEAEEARIAECDATIARIVAAATVTLEDGAESVRARGKEIWEIALPENVFRDKLEAASAAKAATVSTLRTALARLEKEEADRAELERLRAENEARQAKEAAERHEREAAERAAEEARQEELRKAAALEAQALRIRDAEIAAAQAARDEADRLAREAQEARDAEHAAQLAAEKKRADELAEAEAARVAKEAEMAAEKAKREEDQAHKTKIYGAAKAAIMSCGVDEPVAKAIVLAIVAGTVPHVRLEL